MSFLWGAEQHPPQQQPARSVCSSAHLAWGLGGIWGHVIRGNIRVMCT